MTDLSTIREALAAATPGPWTFSDSTDPRGGKGEFRARGPWNGFMLVGPWCNDADPHLIANAPAWLAELVDRVEAAETEVERVRSAARILGKIIDDQCRDVLDIVGAHDLVDEDGDGDWGAIWDLLREQAARGRATQDSVGGAA